MAVVPRALLNLAYLAIFAVAALALILVLGLVDLAVEAPAKALVGWIGQTFGTWGLGVFLVGGPLLAWGFAYRSHQRDLRGQYERDRTIHVLPKRKVSAEAILGTVLVLGAVFLGILAEIIH